MHTIMRITTSTEATPGAGRHSLPITPTQSVETPQGIQKKGAAKASLEYGIVPKSCCLVSTVEKYRSTNATLAKIQQRPKSFCRIATAKKYRSKDAARVSDPVGLPSKAGETCASAEKRVQNAREVNGGRHVGRYGANEEVA